MFLAVLLFLFLDLLCSVPTAWIVMLVLGAVHSQVAAVPAFGFWLTLFVVYAIGLVFGRSHVSR